MLEFNKLLGNQVIFGQSKSFPIVYDHERLNCVATLNDGGLFREQRGWAIALNACLHLFVNAHFP